MENAAATMQMGTQQQLPQYQCHKKVWALKIKHVTVKDSSIFLIPEDEAYAEFLVDKEYVIKHNPQPGGYYVVYTDGYKSYSPAQAFEEGYTLIR